VVAATEEVAVAVVTEVEEDALEASPVFLVAPRCLDNRCADPPPFLSVASVSDHEPSVRPAPLHLPVPLGASRHRCFRLSLHAFSQSLPPSKRPGSRSQAVRPSLSCGRPAFTAPVPIFRMTSSRPSLHVSERFTPTKSGRHKPEDRLAGCSHRVMSRPARLHAQLRRRPPLSTLRLRETCCISSGASDQYSRSERLRSRQGGEW
jgi:hypothetical protein